MSLLRVAVLTLVGFVTVFDLCAFLVFWRIDRRRRQRDHERHARERRRFERRIDAFD